MIYTLVKIVLKHIDEEPPPLFPCFIHQNDIHSDKLIQCNKFDQIPNDDAPVIKQEEA